MMNCKMSLRVLGMLLGVLGVNSMTGQILHSTEPLPSFEVATIKPWTANPRPLHAPVAMKIDPGRSARQQETDRVHFIGQVDLLIMAAYDLSVGSERRILRGPS